MWYSHVAILANARVVLESSQAASIDPITRLNCPSGIRPTSLLGFCWNWPNRYERFVALRNPSFDKEVELLEACAGQYGQHYNWWVNLKPNEIARYEINAPSYCSELICRIYAQLGPQITEKRPSTILPSRLHRLLLEGGWIDVTAEYDAEKFEEAAQAEKRKVNRGETTFAEQFVGTFTYLAVRLQPVKKSIMRVQEIEDLVRKISESSNTIIKSIPDGHIDSFLENLRKNCVETGQDFDILKSAFLSIRQEPTG